MNETSLLVQVGGLVRPFTGFGTTKNDPGNPAANDRTQSFMIHMHDGTARLLYKHRMHHTAWRPSGADGPAKGWRIFRDGPVNDPPALTAQALSVNEDLPGIFRSIKVSRPCACCVCRRYR